MLTFLRVRVHTDLLQLSLPPDKVTHLQEVLRQWKSRKSCTRKELESLVGHLSHAATVVRPGHIFLRNLSFLLSRVSKPYHFIHLNMEARADIAWWQCLLQYWNGLSFFPPTSPSCHMYSDPSGLFGCGTLNSSLMSWFQLQWPTAWVDTGIAAKELVPVVVAAVVWGPRWAGRCICFHLDNDTVVTIIQKRHAKHCLLTELLRCLFFYALFFKVTFISIPYSRHTTRCGRHHFLG